MSALDKFRAQLNKDRDTFQVDAFPGPKGEKGETGPTGLSGGSFTFTQAVASSSWVITHSLGYYPSVTIQDSSGNVIEGDINYPNITTVHANFAVPFTGFAYLS